jgi:hypothetical protein
MLNCVVDRGLLCKRPGYAQFPPLAAALPDAVLSLYTSQKETGEQKLYAAWPAGIVEYAPGTGWAASTGPALTGGGSDHMSFVTSQAGVVFSQGVDSVMFLPFASTTYAALDAGAVPARYLTRAAQRLVLGHTLEGGTARPYRVRYSVSGDHTDWAGLGSGFRDASEFPYHMRGIRALGGRLLVYYEQAIEPAAPTELYTAPLRYDPVILGVGLHSPRTLVSRADSHLFIGNDNVYEFNGNQAVPLADSIRDDLMQSLNPSAAAQNFGVMLPETQEYVLFLCTEGNMVPDTAWVYNWTRKVWYPWSVSGPLCGETYRTSTGETIDALIGTIDVQSWYLGTSSFGQLISTLITGHADGKVYAWSRRYLSDAGASIPCRWTSQDFSGKHIDNPGRQLTLKSLTIEYVDTGIETVLGVYFSTDGGASWNGPHNVTLRGNTLAAQRTAVVTHQVTGDRIRWRITNDTTTETFQIVAFYPEFEKRGSPLAS